MPNTPEHWAALITSAHRIDTISSEQLLEDKVRNQALRLNLAGCHFDFTRQRVDGQILNELHDLARRAGMSTRRDAMFAGEKINRTEGRAVLHTALRAGPDAVISVDGADVMPEVRQTLERMAALAEAVRSGAYAGQGGAFTDIVNIGIGGSDLGPAMAVQALAPYHDGPRCHFVSNVDGAHLADVVKHLDPARTLVIVASKTFTTIETMTNAASARAWMAKNVTDPARQFVALSSSVARAEAFGIPAAICAFVRRTRLTPGPSLLPTGLPRFLFTPPAAGMLSEDGLSGDARPLMRGGPNLALSLSRSSSCSILWCAAAGVTPSKENSRGSDPQGLELALWPPLDSGSNCNPAGESTADLPLS